MNIHTPFIPPNVKFIPVIKFAQVGISDPAFVSRLDLWYVPTLRTFLLQNVFFIRRVGGRGPCLTCCPKKGHIIPEIYPVIYPCDFFPAIFLRNFFPQFFPAIFPRDFTLRFFSAIYG